MNLGPYRLLTQLGAGRDGVSYRAQLPDNNALVEIRVLSAARGDSARWQRLTRRLRLNTLLKHPFVRQVRELHLEQDSPYAVLDWLEASPIAEVMRARLPLPSSDVLPIVLHLSGVLAAAHRVGLVHGRLSPSQVLVSGSGALCLDFTGIDTGQVLAGNLLTELDVACRPPEENTDDDQDFAADIYRLGALVSWLMLGEAGKLPELVETPSALIATSVNLRPDLPDASALLARLVREMCKADPTDRPSAGEVHDSLPTIMVSKAAMQSLNRSSARSADSEHDLVVHGEGGIPPAMTIESAVEVQGRERLAEPLRQPPAPPDDPLARGQLGRFRLLEMLGKGGMGAVYRAEDMTGGTVVAIKTLRHDLVQRPESVRRFHKEARLLAEVNNPYVANLLEVNEDEGIHYLAIEFVPGQSLGRLLNDCGRLDEPTAVAIMADVCRALVEAHRRGIVHRDIKPENILVSGGVTSGEWSRMSEATTHQAPRTTHHVGVKLSDFGLARHVIESDSLNVTQAGAILGTPLYMPPEQCQGFATDPRSDVYAIGATLFHLLAGRPPFQGETPLAVISQHCKTPPPALKKLNPDVSDGICQILDKTLAKAPAARYADAAALLHDLERLLRGEPTSIVVHPRLPSRDGKKVLEYDWVWELDAAPEQLWPYVTNTERFNRAVGVPAVQFSIHQDEGGEVARLQGSESTPQPHDPTTPRPRQRRFGKFRIAGLGVAWEEQPFEWIEGRRFAVLREYHQGPFNWFVSIVELTPRPGGGTILAHRVRIEPRNLIGRTAAAFEIGNKARKNAERVYRRIDAALTGKLGSSPLVDPFEESRALPAARRQRLDRLIDRLVERGVDPAAAERLGEFLAHAPDQEVARIRPLALARRLALPPTQVVAACLHGAREGLLVLLWDLLCPNCRIPSEVKETLRALKDHGHCEACNLDYELDFANSVEMIFRVHAEIRSCETRTYCVGGPAHFPHVAAQVRLGPGERIELEMALTEGAYRLRSPQLPHGLDLRVQSQAPLDRLDWNLRRDIDAAMPRTLRAGSQVLTLTNDHDQELVVRLERQAPRDDALTAARASSLALFRELFAGEVLAPGQLVNVALMTFLVTNLTGAESLYHELGDARAFGLIHEHFRLLEERISKDSGALVKTVGEGLLAVFNDSLAAVQAGLELPGILHSNSTTRGLRLGIAIHRGPAMAATLNEHLDYFGSTVNVTWQLLRAAGGGELLLTDAVTSDPQVASLMRGRGLTGEIVDMGGAGLTNTVVQRVRIH